MGLIQNCLLFLIVYSFTSNSQGKIVKNRSQSVAFDHRNAENKMILFFKVHFTNAFNRGRIAISSTKLHLYVFKRLQQINL